MRQANRQAQHLAAILQSIARSAKYHCLSPATIRDVVLRAGPGRPREIADRARKRLHLILSHYHVCRALKPALARMDAALQQPIDSAEIERACTALLQSHMTSRERFPLLERGYYAEIFARTGRPDSVADLAAALHPFEFPWMGLPATTLYHAYDCNRLFTEATGRFLQVLALGKAFWRDILLEDLEIPVDLAFFLMTYHCLEARRPGAGWDVVVRTPARWMAVSLPRKSLGRRAGRPFEQLIESFRARLEERAWPYEALEWDTETLFLVRKPDQTEVTPWQQGGRRQGEQLQPHSAGTTPSAGS